MRRGRHNRLDSSSSAVTVYFRTDLVGTLYRTVGRILCVIACLGWGSSGILVDYPSRSLNVGGPYRLGCSPPRARTSGTGNSDGPQVRVEFARQSGKERDRLTLVLYDAAERQPSLWARMTVATLDEAIHALTMREHRSIAKKNIASWSNENIGRWSEGKADPTDIPGLSVWATGRDIQDVVWTALKPKFCDLPVAPTEDQAVAFLRTLSDDERATEARKCVRRAPPQIDTAYRRRIIRCLGWTCGAPPS